MLEFEWDENKNQSNIIKHKIPFAEAATAFKDPLSLCFFDPDHSEDELRYILIGISEKHNILVISYTERDDSIRIISAREATKGEQIHYQQQGQ